MNNKDDDEPLQKRMKNGSTSSYNDGIAVNETDGSRIQFIEGPIPTESVKHFEYLDHDEVEISSNPGPSRRYAKDEIKVPLSRSKNGKALDYWVTDTAKINGMDTVDHNSGAKFAVPLTVQAHITKVIDRVLDEKNDNLSQFKPFPYCCQCHGVVKTWQGLEYHILKEHVKFRAFRCYHCTKETFYTEEEGRFHMAVNHGREESTLIQICNRDAELKIRKAFKYVFLMCRDGPNVTPEKIEEWETEAYHEMMKFRHLRFKRPTVLTKLPTFLPNSSQTIISAGHYLLSPSQPTRYLPGYSVEVQRSSEYAQERRRHDIAEAAFRSKSGHRNKQADSRDLIRNKTHHN